ncbi:LuxR C-terminal-related transcriptional regulator [Flavobacterium silvaticum]|uniref:PAS domain-containing protein n=1 Tax=Flavobacterium silvaticum TaxID=1852020 RepID=A0A972FX40_9FLAO|nr:LuxR C-terminal-related transcriptional regulator [Flavobacterium silvaticum]NMH29632.1 PAS domain-containing protein [Flavobacterium silvaticum]
MKPSLFSQAQTVWKSVMSDLPEAARVDISVYKKILELFHVGRFYYYFIDWRLPQMVFISPEIEDILGFPSSMVDIPFLMSLIHEDDHPTFLNHEATVVEFLGTLSPEQKLRYKMSYDYRIKKADGTYIRILQQAIALKCDDDGNLLLTLGVHTDISHLKDSKKSVLSFLGLEGEPSYIDVKPKEIFEQSAELFTAREKEIIGYILRGNQTSEIAQALNISRHTVDSHRKNILSKSGTKSTLDLAMKVISEGLI